MKIKFKEILDETWFPYAIIFLIAIVIVIILGLKIYSQSEEEFDWIGFHTESLGMVLDIIFLGIIWAVFDHRRSKKLEIKRYKEELRDYKYWKGEEASYRIAGIVRRLNRKKFYDIDISMCNLKDATLFEVEVNRDILGTNFSNAKLSGAIFKNIDLSQSIFNDALLVNAKFNGSILTYVSFKGASLNNADFRGCKSVDNAFFWASKFIETAKFDDNVDVQKLKLQRVEDSKFNTVKDFFKYRVFIEEYCRCSIIGVELDEIDNKLISLRVTKEYFHNFANIIDIKIESENYFEGNLDFDKLKELMSKLNLS